MRLNITERIAVIGTQRNFDEWSRNQIDVFRSTPGRIVSTEGKIFISVTKPDTLRGIHWDRAIWLNDAFLTGVEPKDFKSRTSEGRSR